MNLIIAQVCNHARFSRLVLLQTRAVYVHVISCACLKHVKRYAHGNAIVSVIYHFPWLEIKLQNMTPQMVLFSYLGFQTSIKKTGMMPVRLWDIYITWVMYSYMRQSCCYQVFLLLYPFTIFLQKKFDFLYRKCVFSLKGIDFSRKG